MLAVPHVQVKSWLAPAIVQWHRWKPLALMVAGESKYTVLVVTPLAMSATLLSAVRKTSQVLSNSRMAGAELGVKPMN